MSKVSGGACRSGEARSAEESARADFSTSDNGNLLSAVGDKNFRCWSPGVVLRQQLYQVLSRQGWGAYAANQIDVNKCRG